MLKMGDEVIITTLGGTYRGTFKGTATIKAKGASIIFLRLEANGFERLLNPNCIISLEPSQDIISIEPLHDSK